MIVTAAVGTIWQDLGVLVIISIICTGGISLIAWLPFWWLVGHAIIALFSSFNSRIGTQAVGNADSSIPEGRLLGQKHEQRQTPSSSSSAPLSIEPDQIMLRNYIRTMLGDFHHSREEIARRLLKKGWSNQAIDEAYQAVVPDVTQN
jgi:hypothetical protein